MELRRNDKTKWGPGEERRFWPSKDAWNAYVLAIDAETTPTPVVTPTSSVVIQEIPLPRKTAKDHVQNIKDYLERIENIHKRHDKTHLVIELMNYLSNEAPEFMKKHNRLADTIARKCYEFKVDRQNSDILRKTCNRVLKILNRPLFATPCRVIKGRCGDCNNCDIVNDDPDTGIQHIAINNLHYPCMKQQTQNIVTQEPGPPKVESVSIVEKMEEISKLRPLLQTMDSSPAPIAENLCKELVLYLSKPENLSVLRVFHCFRMEARARVHMYLKTDLATQFLTLTDF
jgi:hypothetical protein